MTRSLIVALIVIVVGLGLSGRGRDVGETSPGPDPPNRITTSRAPSSLKPPDSSLTLGKDSVIGVLGSYCWESVSGTATAEAVTGCVDAAGIPIPPEDGALIVPQNCVLVFDYGGRWPPTSMNALAYPLDQEEGSLAGPGGVRLLVPTEGRSALATEDLQVSRLGSRLGDRAQLPVSLPAGEYVVEVSVRVPEGEAAYYFRVAVGVSSLGRAPEHPRERTGRPSSGPTEEGKDFLGPREASTHP